jgi:hypothetical protein
MTDHTSLIREFPDFDIATLPAIPEGFVAAHWRYEPCPHWTKRRLNLFVDFVDRDVREFPDSERFSLYWARDAEGTGDLLLLVSTDDWGVILAGLENVTALLAAAEAA